MSIIAVEARARRVVAATPAAAWAPVARSEDLAALLGVERCTPIAGGWRWDLGQRGAMGRSAQVLFDVALEPAAPHEVRFRPIGDAARWATGTSTVRATPAGPGEAELSIEVPLRLELPIPRLVAAPIGAVIRQQLQSMADGFVARWADRIAS